jgi:phosphoadenosine phosphosulfate reductase
MFKVRWEKNNLVVLDDNTLNPIQPPRPVYFEELDLLGFDKYWTYSKSDKPLMWAIGRDYYYCGEKVAKTIGGDLYNAPKLEIYKKNFVIKAIDVEELIKVNKKHIETLKNEAIEFIKKIYNDYRKKVDFFIVAFSGGKDSQVLLDLVTIALEPDQYKVIFTDTTMELPHTYETVKNTQKHYQKIYKDFKITTVRNPIDAEELWKVFGSPSMNFRWCCNVYKTSPVINYLKSLNKRGIPKIILFNGVRAEESSKRAEHNRIARGVKHHSQINIEVIKYWNDFEVYLYCFYANIKLNMGYKLGFDRMGCSICPLAKNKNDFLVKKVVPDLAEKFINIVKKDAEKLHIKDLKKYIKDGAWKRRNENNNNPSSFVSFIENTNNLIINLKESNENIFEWLKVLGDYKINSNNIQINIGNKILNIDYSKNKNSVTLSTKKDDIIIISRLKKVAYKTSYCVHCGSCEAECPTGALSVFPKVKVDTSLCIHCSKCLDFNNKGCVMADVSVSKINQGNNNILKGFGKYQNFAIQSNWLNDFLNNESWFENNSLGNKQILSMIAWMKEAEIIDPKKNITTFGNLLKNIDVKLIYQLVLINLYQNSNLIKWYLDNIKWGDERYSKKDFLSLIEQTSNNFPKRSVEIGLTSLFKLFDTTPLGKDLKIGYITKEKNIRYIQKIGSNNISNEAILYSLYKLKENLKRDDFRVSEFYEDGFEGGPYKIFGINKETLINKLKFISEDTKLIDVNLIQGLDNVFLKDFSAIEVLEEVLK